MKTELEKCMAGEWYDCHDPVFIEGKACASAWCARYNAIQQFQRMSRHKMLCKLFGAMGDNYSTLYGLIKNRYDYRYRGKR